MAHYQITVTTVGKCLERMVEDVYNSDGNIVTNILGPWRPCQKRHVGLGRSGKGGAGSRHMSRDAPQALMRIVAPTLKPKNDLLTLALVIGGGFIIYKYVIKK
jgi:hypothetical protein